MALSADQALARLGDQVEAAVLRRLQAAAGEFEGVLVATPVYGDDTGANRAGTFAAAATAERPGRANQRARQAFGEVARLNAGHESAEEIDLPPGVVRVVGSTMTDYARHLEQDRAGAHAYLADSLRLEAPRLQAAALAGIREVFR